jgi:hypothetical protein
MAPDRSTVHREGQTIGGGAPIMVFFAMSGETAREVARQAGGTEIVNDRCENNLSALSRQPIEVLLSR